MGLQGVKGFIGIKGGLMGFIGLKWESLRSFTHSP